MQGSTRARRLRSNQTEAERQLWYRLRDRRLDGYKFRRQVALGRYVADFVCMSSRVIVEIDGGQHAQRRQYDAQRTRQLQNEGFAVLRFWNNEVMQNLDGVLCVLVKVLAERARARTLTLPSP